MVVGGTSYLVPKKFLVEYQGVVGSGVGVGCSDSDGWVFGSGRGGWGGLCDI